MVFKKDIIYHSDKKVVGSYDERIVSSYRFEHRYITFQRWTEDFKRRKYERVLDFGCGTGNASRELSLQRLEVFAMDTSLEMLKAAKGKASSARLTGGDGERIPFRDKTFDALVCMGVLHHIENKERAVAEMIRVVREGGMICISEPYECRKVIIALYNAILFIPRMIRNLFQGLHILETEHPLTRRDVEESVRGAAAKSGKTVRWFCYIYPSAAFRMLPDRLARLLFRWMNPHLKCLLTEGKCEIQEENGSYCEGNIISIKIEC